MIIIHVNCSYSLSPVGFWYGSFRYEAGSGLGEPYSLSELYNTSFVQRAFDHNFVTGIQGKIPYKPRYLYLFKGCRYSFEDHEDEKFGREVEINLGFEFDDEKEFGTFAANIEKERLDRDPFCRRLANLVVPSPEDKIFGVRIDRGELNRLVEESCVGEAKDLPGECVRFEVQSENVDYSESIAQVFGLKQENIKFSGNMYIYESRKPRSPLLLPLAVAGIALLVAIVISMI